MDSIRKSRGTDRDSPNSRRFRGCIVTSRRPEACRSTSSSLELLRSRGVILGETAAHNCFRKIPSLAPDSQPRPRKKISSTQTPTSPLFGLLLFRSLNCNRVAN